nr:MAG TPA: hypothetical protein [Caudoviricetes sp.]
MEPAHTGFTIPAHTGIPPIEPAHIDKDTKP